MKEKRLEEQEIERCVEKAELEKKKNRGSSGKRKKIIAGASSAILALGMTVASSSDIFAEKKEKEEDLECERWKMNDETQAYECKDKNSSSSGHFYYMGGIFTSNAQVKNSATYQNRQARVMNRQQLTKGARGAFTAKSATKTVSAKPKTSLKTGARTSVKSSVKGASGIGKGASGSFGG